MKKALTSEAAILLQKAQKRLKKKPPKEVSQLSEAETAKLIFELEVHQVQLELQTEELMRARSAAKDATEKYTELYDFAPSAYFTLSKEGEIINLNISGSQILGKERTRLINSRFDLFISDDTKPVFNLFLKKTINSKTKETCEVILVSNGNIPMYVQLNGIITENGELCLVTVVDITGRILAEKALMESDERFQLLFNKIPLGYQSLDFAGNFIEVNQQWLDMFGYTRVEVIGKWFGDFLSPAYQVGFRKRFPIFKAVGKIHSEFEMVHKNGKRLFIVLEGKIGYDLNREFKQTHCILQDITERKQAEEALKESKEKYCFLSENISDVIWIFDLTQDKFTYISPSVFQLRGFTQAEAMAEGINEAFTPESAQKVIIDLSIRIREFQNGILKTYIDQVQQPCKDGSIKWIEIVSKYQFAEDGTIEIHGVSRDISGRKQAEIEMQLKNEELFKINAEKDKFFSIIAHDLRSPFNGFLGLTELMAEGLPNMTLDEIQKISLVMRNSAINLFHLLENLLEWSRMQRGLAIFVPESFLLMPKISEIMVIVLEAAIKKEITIGYAISKELVVFADENMLEIIIRNLMSNAVKFTPHGGSIIVSANSAPDRSVEISIKDSGIGMSKNMIDQLFNLDVNTNRKGTEGENSTGLGLIICKDFIEKHGGKLWIESEEGKGSTFRFSLPANPDHVSQI